MRSASLDWRAEFVRVRSKPSPIPSSQQNIFPATVQNTQVEILLNANPLAYIGNSDRIHGVMLRCQWLPASELETRLKNYEVANDG